MELRWESCENLKIPPDNNRNRFKTTPAKPLTLQHGNGWIFGHSANEKLGIDDRKTVAAERTRRLPPMVGTGYPLTTRSQQRKAGYHPPFAKDKRSFLDGMKKRNRIVRTTPPSPSGYPGIKNHPASPPILPKTPSAPMPCNTDSWILKFAP